MMRCRYEQNRPLSAETDQLKTGKTIKKGKIFRVPIGWQQIYHFKALCPCIITDEEEHNTGLWKGHDHPDTKSRYM